MNLRIFFAILAFVTAPETLYREAVVSHGPTLTQYWRETGLDLGDLERYLGANCQSSEIEFMTCIAGLQAMGKKENQELNMHYVWRPLNPAHLSEKDQVEPFREIATSEFLRKQFPMDSLIAQLMQSTSVEKRPALIAAGINGYYSVRYDPHTYIVPVRYFEEVLSTSSSQLQNYGFISRRVKSGAFIRKVFEGTAASRAGIKKGDRILSVNGQSIDSMGLQDLSEALRLRVGEPITLVVQSRSGQTREIKLNGLEQNIANVVTRLLPGKSNVGLITMHRFTQESCVEVTNAVSELKQSGVRGLIFDLRDNPGGQVDEAACIANLFLPKGMNLFETRSFNGGEVRERYVSQVDPIFDGPLSILINGGSASAAEIVAGVLKDAGRATLVGERSFGKGTFQDGQIWDRAGKIAIFMTKGLFYFASGWTPQLVGLEPDIKSETPEGETLREEDLYINPIRPLDFWNGPQSLSWFESGCEILSTQVLAIEDQQVQTALNQTLCRVGGL